MRCCRPAVEAEQPPGGHAARGCLITPAVALRLPLPRSALHQHLLCLLAGVARDDAGAVYCQLAAARSTGRHQSGAYQPNTPPSCAVCACPPFGPGHAALCSTPTASTAWWWRPAWATCPLRRRPSPPPQVRCASVCPVHVSTPLALQTVRQCGGTAFVDAIGEGAQYSCSS